jgi:hypothetical protein
MEKNFERIGFVKYHPEVELVKIDGIIYALDGWNGEEFGRCWQHDDPGEKFTVRPVYQAVDEDEDDYEIIGYEVK